MALNPPIAPNGLPYRMENEYVLLEREGMEIKVKSNGRSDLKGSGKIFLTTGRLTFVHKDFKNNNFKSFDMPIAKMSKYSFN